MRNTVDFFGMGRHIESMRIDIVVRRETTFRGGEWSRRHDSFGGSKEGIFGGVRGVLDVYLRQSLLFHDNQNPLFYILFKSSDRSPFIISHSSSSSSRVRGPLAQQMIFHPSDRCCQAGPRRSGSFLPFYVRGCLRTVQEGLPHTSIINPLLASTSVTKYYFVHAPVPRGQNSCVLA